MSEPTDSKRLDLYRKLEKAVRKAVSAWDVEYFPEIRKILKELDATA